MNAPWFKFFSRLSAFLAAAIALSACQESVMPPASTVASAASAAAPAATPAAAKPASYHAAKYDPIHFKPAIEKATDQQCLACHAEVLKPSVR